MPVLEALVFCRQIVLFFLRFPYPLIVSQGPLSAYMSGEAAADKEDVAEVDTEALAAAHVNAIAGACLAIGIRYAGSCNGAAQALLQGHALALLRAKEGAC